MNRKNQHHIWRRYLLPWTSDGKLYCLRDGKIFEPNLKNVASQRYFYRTEQLTDAEIDFIEMFAISQAPIFLKDVHRDWIKLCNAPFALLDELKAQGANEKALTDVRILIENNLHEEMHGQIEQSAIKFMDALSIKDTNFFQHEEMRTEFLFYLSIQYMRTHKVKQSVLERSANFLKDRIGYNLERLWNPLCYIFATNIAYGLSRAPFRLVLLENSSDLPFVTGDQPVVNTHATGLPLDEQVAELEFYYPISPQLAILVTKSATLWADAVVRLDRQTVAHFNGHILGNSRHEIYSNSRDILDSIIAEI